MKTTDIAIVGAGPAGLSLAASLVGSGLKVTLLEQQDLESIAKPSPDGREIALTHLSVKLMKASGAWQHLPDNGISRIAQARVLDGESDYSLKFNAEGEGLEALGYMVPNYLIRKACYEVAAEKEDISLINGVKVNAIEASADKAVVSMDNGGQLQARLVVGADSRFSVSRRMLGISADMHDFGRSAIVCRMSHDRSNQGIASECFHYGRTLAILPLEENLSSVVITVKSPDADAVMSMTSEQFDLDVAKRFEDRLGVMQLEGERYQYPLVAVHANKFYAQRFALVGDAAVGMHPVTAHGFNLGLRGQDTLARLIVDAHTRGASIACETLLRKYHRRHWNVSRPLYLGTNGIVGLFTDDRPLAKVARKGLLRLSNRLPPLKKLITRQLTEAENKPFLPGFLSSSR